MTVQQEALAYYLYPEPGKTLYESDLQTEQAVVHLFDYCQILEASVFAKGWEFLMQRYGAKKLYELDKISGWFGGEDFADWIGILFYYALSSGFNPESGRFGTYDQESGIFSPHNGKAEEPDLDRYVSRL